MKTTAHILYIEDNEFNQRLTKKILQPAGFTISQALDGIQGIKKAVDLRPDLILMDLDLPNLDGLGVAAKIKSVPGLEKIPLVALTSRRTKRERDRALVVGCDGYIEKPIDAVTFPSQIRTYLEGKREVSGPSDKTRILQDFNLKLIDQLQTKIEELEQKNRELVQSKEDLQSAYQQSQTANQEMQRLTKLKENIVTITSHELRTPLSIATGYIDLLEEGVMGNLGPDQRHALQITGQSLSKMRELIDKITDLTRLALKKFPMTLIVLDLNKTFLNTYEELAIFMKIRNLELRNQLRKGPVKVLADANLLGQVFSNLLKNAISFTPDGGRITVSTKIEKNKAYFRIEDTGIGIIKDDHQRIFDEFYQVQDVIHHKTGHFEYMTRGIGVGLALCQGILHELGGKISVRSPGLNQGSVFTFYLPMVK